MYNHQSDLPKQNDENQVLLLYKKLLESWNNQDAIAYTDLFARNSHVIGFDGSQMNGSEEIYSELKRIFEHHKVASYVSIVKEVSTLSPDLYLLRAVAGMVPPGKSEINPRVNTVQTLLAKKEEELFKIVLFQNTPAAFHERPDLSEQLSTELQLVLDNQKSPSHS